jgi:hypothetical protein
MVPPGADRPETYLPVRSAPQWGPSPGPHFVPLRTIGPQNVPKAHKIFAISN